MYSVITEFKIGPEVGVKYDMLNNAPARVGDDTLAGYELCDFSLKQDMMTPYVFRFTMRRKNFHKTLEMARFSLASDLVGKEVECKVETRINESTAVSAHSTLSFKGTILNASMKGMAISCEAFGKDCKYDSAPKSRCFCGKKISEIVSAVASGTNVRIHTCFDNLKFPYIVQYNETDYAFLIRLAKRFGAFFYHDGNNLVFGKPDKSAQNRVTLASSDFASLKFSVKTGGPNLKFVAHDYKQNLDLVSAPTDFNRSTSGAGHSGGHLFASAVAGSDDFKADWEFFIDDPNGIQSDPAATDLNAYNKAIIGSYSSDLVTCSLLTYNLGVHVGSIVKLDQKIKITALNGTITETNVENGTLFVTSAHITWDCNGSPENEVTAFVLPEDSTAEDDIFAPYMDYNAYPKSSAQRAEVYDNVDPDKMGRVQVFYSWQKDLKDAEKKDLPWIRIAQPYGGDKDGKGFYVLPEKKEEVMVGFEHENMEKPFVIGTLFHGAAKNKENDKQLPDNKWCEVPAKDGDPAKNEENEVKAFRTKKGHTIEFHDTKKGDGFIRIYGNNNSDKENYDIILSTDPIKTGQNKDQDYQIKSAEDSPEKGKPIKEKEDYKAEKLRIMVRSNGGDIFLDAGNGDIIMNAKNIRFHASGNRTTLIDGKDVLKVKGEQHTFADSSSLMVQNVQTVKILGDAKETYQKSLTLEVSGDVKVSSNKNLSVETKQKTEVTANQDVKVTAKTGVEVTAKTGIELSGGTKTVLKGTKVDVSGDTNTILKGAQVTVGDDLSKTTIQGANVEFDAAIAGVRKGMWTDQ